MSLLLHEQFDLVQEWVPAFAGKTRKENKSDSISSPKFSRR